jgi:hypothetical protein
LRVKQAALSEPEQHARRGVHKWHRLPALHGLRTYSMSAGLECSAHDSTNASSWYAPAGSRFGASAAACSAAAALSSAAMSAFSKPPSRVKNLKPLRL